MNKCEFLEVPYCEYRNNDTCNCPGECPHFNPTFSRAELEDYQDLINFRKEHPDE